MSLIPTVNVRPNLSSQRLLDIALTLGVTWWLLIRFCFNYRVIFKGYPPESIPPTRPWTDQNKVYTIRLCQGPGILVVGTGIANLMQDLLVAGGTQLLTDEVLHSKLLGLVVGGIDVYGIYKDYAQEEQVMNMITMSAPPAGPVPIRTLRVIHSISPIH